MTTADILSVKIRELEQYGIHVSKLYVDRDTFQQLLLELSALRSFDSKPPKLKSKPKIQLLGRKIFCSR